jgi:hypothetical protein
LTGYDVVETTARRATLLVRVVDDILGTHKSDIFTEIGQFWHGTPHETTILAISNEKLATCSARSREDSPDQLRSHTCGDRSPQEGTRSPVIATLDQQFSQS